MRPRYASAWTSLGLVLMLVLSGCTAGTPRSPGLAGAVNAKATTLLTIGGSATEGDGLPDRLHDAWPYLLWDQAFPVSTSLVNAALDDATIKNAQADQLPLAQEVKPQVVAVWLGIDDLAQHTPIDQFAAELRALIDELRATGAQRILVADLPDAFGAGAVSYNTATRSVVQSTKATLVELEHAAISIAPSRGLADQPDAAAHRVVVSAFEQALKRP
jgi:lysophospholipase L1-like esterase